jgi:hypothetical protein
LWFFRQVKCQMNHRNSQFPCHCFDSSFELSHQQQWHCQTWNCCEPTNRIQWRSNRSQLARRSKSLKHAFGGESDPGESSQPVSDRKTLWMDWMMRLASEQHRIAD